MNKPANAAALGYGVFALILWLTSMAPAGWFDPPSGNLRMLLLVAGLGGCVLAIAGIMQWIRGHALDALLFLAFAGYWWIHALAPHPLTVGAAAPASSGFLGWYYAAWALLGLCACMAAWRRDSARTLFSLGLWLSLFAYALAHWLRFDALLVLGGYLGLVTAVVAIYIAAATLINEVHANAVLPLGEADRNGQPAASGTTPPQR
ncbi:MAG: transcriptional regulator [Rhodanobacteraceae bacterium]|nr:MAG: transcriptional regulator [Rhodanobacteraceae bacterium]